MIWLLIFIFALLPLIKQQRVNNARLTSNALRELGLRVSTEMPPEFYSLMALYPQPPQRRPSVQYVPLPTESREDDNR